MLAALSGIGAVGAGLHVGGSVLIVFGQTIVKVFHCIEESSPAEKGWLLPNTPAAPLWRRPDGRWRRQVAGSKSYAALGWLLFAVGNAMRFISMRFAAQTVLSGLGSLQFVLIPIASRALLGIRARLSTVLGVAVVLLGNVLIIMYGPPEVSFTLRQLREQWSSRAMEAFLIVLGGLLCSLQLVWWHLTGQLGGQQHSQQHGLQQQQKGAAAKPAAQQQQQQFLLSVTAGSRGSSPTAAVAAGAAEDWEGGKAGSEQAAAQVFLGALLFSAVASFIGAWSVLFSKSLTYVVTALPGSLRDWYSWFVVAAFLGTAAFWVRQSDRGLRLYPASLIMPLMQAFWMVMSVVEGGIYFEELVLLPANSLLLLMLGLALALAGAVAMGIAGYVSEQRDATLARMQGGDVERLAGVQLEPKSSGPVPPPGAIVGGWAGKLSPPCPGGSESAVLVIQEAPGGGRGVCLRGEGGGVGLSMPVHRTVTGSGGGKHSGADAAALGYAADGAGAGPKQRRAETAPVAVAPLLQLEEGHAAQEETAVLLAGSQRRFADWGMPAAASMLQRVRQAF